MYGLGIGIIHQDSGIKKYFKNFQWNQPLYLHGLNVQQAYDWGEIMLEYSYIFGKTAQIKLLNFL